MKPAAWAALLLLAALPSQAQEPPQRLRLALHVHTTVSTGSLTLEEAALEASTEGLDGILFTDSLLRRWEYGLWPARGVVKKRVEQPSVLTFGAQRYVESIHKLSRQFPRLLVMAGVEAAPFYYWRRSPFDQLGGEIHDWNQHLLVMGLEDGQVLERLPLETADSYHGDAGAAPYQQFIDAVTAQGGLVFWAHPETPHEGRHGSVMDYTEAYPHLLELTHGYQGFAITYLDHLDIVAPGGTWDRLLQAYCRGERPQPVWVIAESDWRGPQERPLAMSTTELFVEERTPEGVRQALIGGHAWAAIRRADSHLELSEFQIEDPILTRAAQAGDQFRLAGTHELTVRVSGIGDGGRLILVKNGQVISSEDVARGPFSREWAEARPEKTAYYRVILEGPWGVIYTNPVFVR